ncbi:MAG: SDR family oxidoreductase [Alphaproteobacteria bacterium]
MATVVITGCDYGIGYEFARAYAVDGWRVHAVCLQASSQARLGGVGDTHVHRLDVTDEAGVQALAQRLSDEPVDVLINNAATFARGQGGLFDLPTTEDFLRVLHVNAVAPLLVARAFAPHVAKGEHKVMAFLSTRSASIDDNTSGGHYDYRMSKTALNMAVKGIACDLAAQGVMSVALHPGSVATETRKGAPVKVADSVAGMRAVIEAMTPAMSGTFQRYDGGTIPW